jgi:hypothetical protein
MNSLWRGVALGGLIIVSFAVPAFAQAEQGDKEVLLNGDITTSFGGEADPTTGVEPGSVTTGNLSAGLGYYFTQAVEGFGAINLGFSRDATAGTSVDAGFALAFRYNFSRMGRQMVPYVGVQYAMNSVKDPGDSSYVQPNGGFKYYLRPKVAFDVNISYGHGFSSAGGSIFRESVGLVFGF